ncbi:MAG TPA: hypothetical protein VGC89_03765 [Pyrinomonadaceae bacterium]
MSRRALRNEAERMKARLSINDSFSFINAALIAHPSSMPFSCQEF